MAVVEFARWGQVMRVENANGHGIQVVLRFHEPLPFRPGHQDHCLETEPMLV
jgi:hypothetical protein